MMIDDDVLAARIPRLGTITTGHGVEAVSQRTQKTYARPTRSDTLVFHTNDEPVAKAVHARLGGTVVTDSPNWAYDVVTASRSCDVGALPQGFRQALESWRAAECLRRCDGVRMVTEGGRPVDKLCVCATEIERGQERVCSPTTVLPVFVELDVERFGVWEVRSNSWGTAAMLKGTMRALAMVGATTGMVPAVLAMVSRTVRDGDGKPHDVEELHLTIAQSRRSLEALAGAAVALDAPPAALPAEGSDDARRLTLMQQWTDLVAQAARKGLRDQLRADFTKTYGDCTPEDLSVADLDAWVVYAGNVLWDAESPQEPSNGSGEATPPAEAPAGQSG